MCRSSPIGSTTKSITNLKSPPVCHYGDTISWTINHITTEGLYDLRERTYIIRVSIYNNPCNHPCATITIQLRQVIVDWKTNTLYQNECVRIDFHSIKSHALGEKIHGILNPISRESMGISKNLLTKQSMKY